MSEVKQTIPLTELAVETIARVVAVNGTKEIRRNIISMGISVDVKLKVERNLCSFSNSIIVNLYGTRLAISSVMAEKIMVDPLPA